MVYFLAEAQKETENMVLKKEKKNEENICVICMTIDREGVFVECGHMVCCMACSKTVKICPICRKNIIKTIKIFK